MEIAIAIDNIRGHGADSQLLADVCSKLQAAGHTVKNVGVGPNRVQHHMLSNTHEVMIQIGGGICLGTLVDFIMGIKRGYYHAKKGTFLYYTATWKTQQCDTWKATRAHDDNFSKSGDIKPYIGKTLPEIYGMHTDVLYKYGQGKTADELVQSFLTGSSGSGGSSVVIEEGFVESGRGGTKESSPQFWNEQNYTPYTEIPFTDFTVTEEFPRTMSMEFDTTENIDLTSGRVAVLLRGDCNPFGGIVIDKDYNSDKGLYTYAAQGFMERIMANGIHAVYNGSKTVHAIITEVLADLGVPDTGLLPIEKYEQEVPEDLEKAMEKDKELTETGDAYDMNYNLEHRSTIKDHKMNPMERKPKGIYDKDSIYDFFCTILYDYGVNIDFYGDPNGIPHFDVMKFEDWKKDVFIFSPRRGFESDYTYKYDITDQVNQVVVKSINATSGTGEIYTAEELLKVPLQDYQGRMGVVVDNPAGSGTTTAAAPEYQDSSGKKYNSSQVLTTNGQPSCKHCLAGKPSIQKYTKYWFNECPKCEKEGILSSESDGDGTTKCGECETEFCQYCGFDRKGQKLHLTELFVVNNNASATSVTTDSSTDTSSTATTSTTS